VKLGKKPTRALRKATRLKSLRITVNVKVGGATSKRTTTLRR